MGSRAGTRPARARSDEGGGAPSGAATSARGAGRRWFGCRGGRSAGGHRRDGSGPRRRGAFAPAVAHGAAGGRLDAPRVAVTWTHEERVAANWEALRRRRGALRALLLRASPLVLALGLPAWTWLRPGGSLGAGLLVLLGACAGLAISRRGQRPPSRASASGRGGAGRTRCARARERLSERARRGRRPLLAGVTAHTGERPHHHDRCRGRCGGRRAPRTGRPRDARASPRIRRP